MEYRASETGPENLRRDDEFGDEDVGRKDFMFVSGMGIIVVIAILFAIFA
jgi:hypothetical protein